MIRHVRQKTNPIWTHHVLGQNVHVHSGIVFFLLICRDVQLFNQDVNYQNIFLHVTMYFYKHDNIKRL